MENVSYSQKYKDRNSSELEKLYDELPDKLSDERFLEILDACNNLLTMSNEAYDKVKNKELHDSITSLEEVKKSLLLIQIN